MIKLNKASRLRLATHNAKSILWERNTKKLLSLSVAYFATIVSMAEAQDMPKTAAEMGIMQGTPPQRTIDISEWDKGPDNRWAFSTSVKLFRLRISEGGQVQSLHFKSHLKTSRGCNFWALDGVQMSVQDMLVRTCTDGFIALHEGDVVYEKYFNGLQWMPFRDLLLIDVLMWAPLFVGTCANTASPTL